MILPLAELERRYILGVLGRCGGDKRRAAALLGISLKTLYNKLARWGVREYRGHNLKILAAAGIARDRKSLPGGPA